LAHLEACPECAAELAALKGVQERLRAAAPSWPPAGRTAAPHPLLVPRRENTRRGWSAAAAAGLALAFLTTWLGHGAPAPGNTIAPAAPGVRTSAPAEVWPGEEYSMPAVLDAVQDELSAAQTEPAQGAESILLAPSDEEIP
jgi:anti-sigma factor RsiW